LKNIIFHIKLFRHFEFSRKKFFHGSFIFYPKYKKIKKIEKNIIFENVYIWKTKKTKTVRSAVFKKSKTLLNSRSWGFFLNNLIN
jgi:hypothetical protein